MRGEYALNSGAIISSGKSLPLWEDLKNYVMN